MSSTTLPARFHEERPALRPYFRGERASFDFGYRRVPDREGRLCHGGRGLVSDLPGPDPGRYSRSWKKEDVLSSSRRRRRISPFGGMAQLWKPCPSSTGLSLSEAVDASDVGRDMPGEKSSLTMDGVRAPTSRPPARTGSRLYSRSSATRKATIAIGNTVRKRKMQARRAGVVLGEFFARDGAVQAPAHEHAADRAPCGRRSVRGHVPRCRTRAPLRTPAIPGPASAPRALKERTEAMPGTRRRPPTAEWYGPLETSPLQEVRVRRLQHRDRGVRAGRRREGGRTGPPMARPPGNLGEDLWKDSEANAQAPERGLDPIINNSGGIRGGASRGGRPGGSTRR